MHVRREMHRCQVAVVAAAPEAPDQAISKGGEEEGILGKEVWAQRVVQDTEGIEREKLLAEREDSGVYFRYTCSLAKGA